MVTKARTINKEQRLHEKLLAAYQRQQTWLKWTVVGLLMLVVLLILLLGYATDWFQGIRKDSLQSLPTSGQPNETTGNTAQQPAEGTTNNRTSTDSTTNTSRESTTTTTNNTTSTTTHPAPSPSLLALYSDANAGDSLQIIIDEANSLGLDVECEDGLLGFRVCTVRDDNGTTVTIKGLNDLITSVLNDF